MRGTSSVFLSAAAALVAAGSSVASLVDQDSPSQNQNNAFAYLFPGNGHYQTFKQTNNNISGATIYTSFGQQDTVKLSIWDGAPDGGGVPVSGANGSAVAQPFSQVDIFWSPVSINPGQTYYLLIESAGNQLITDQYNFDNYANGDVYYYGTNYSQFGYNLAFKTWYDVPAPGSAALLGLGGLFAARRRRA
jgi:hypothetical protein